MAARFRAARTDIHPVMPNHIAHEKHLPLYLEETDSLEDVTLAWNLQYAYLRQEAAKQRSLLATPNRVSDKQVLRLVLSDESSRLGALMRYVLALRFDLPDMVKLWRESAMDQYVLSPTAFETVVGGWLPNEFKKEASRRTVGATGNA